MSYNANISAKNFRITRSTPKGGESAVATLARGLIRPDNHTVSHRVDAYGQLVEDSGKIGRTLYEDFVSTAETTQVAVIGTGGVAHATTTNLVHHIYTPGGNVLGQANIGVQTTPPAIIAEGLDIGGVQTDAIGQEIFSHFLGASGRPFIAQVDPAFFFESKIYFEDSSGVGSLVVGFRRAEAAQLAFASYADYAGLGITTGAADDIRQLTGNDGTDVNTSTTGTVVIANTTATTFRVNVSAAGLATFAVDGVANTPAAFTFDAGDPVIPFVFFINTADLAGKVAIQTWKAGYQ